MIVVSVFVITLLLPCYYFIFLPSHHRRDAVITQNWLLLSSSLNCDRSLSDWRTPPPAPPPSSLCHIQPWRLLSPPQGMVLPAVPWGAQPHVLSLRVRRQKQLLSADQPGLLHQPRPPHVLPLHRPLHRHGERRFFVWGPLHRCQVLGSVFSIFIVTCFFCGLPKDIFQFVSVDNFFFLIFLYIFIAKVNYFKYGFLVSWTTYNYIIILSKRNKSIACACWHFNRLIYRAVEAVSPHWAAPVLFLWLFSRHFHVIWKSATGDLDPR